MAQIKIVKLIDANGRAFGVNQEGNDLIIRSKAQGYTGASFQFMRIDPSSCALKTVGHAEAEIHEEHAFTTHVHEVDFDKANEIGILFTTPNTLSRCHAVALAYCGVAAIFDICEAPTLDTGNYPTTFYTPINRNRNSNNASGVLSVRAAPVVNRVSLKLKADTAPITGSGTVIHVEMIGSGKQGGGSGSRDTDEYILKQNTTYYFRLRGTPNGADASVASLQVTWFEHTDLE